MAAPASQSQRLVYADLESLPEDNLRRELIDGELFVTPAPRLRHQDVVLELAHWLRAHTKQAGGKVFGSPVDVMFTRSDVVEPDLVFVRAEHSDRITDKFIDGAPDLVVEVSSPSTRQVDLGRKRRLYERFGVGEYWFVDLDADRVQVYRLVDDRYDEPVLIERGATLHSPLLPGFALSVDELFDL